MQLFCPTVEHAIATGVHSTGKLKPCQYRTTALLLAKPGLTEPTIPFEAGGELPNVVGVHPRRVFSVSYEENTLFFV